MRRFYSLSKNITADKIVISDRQEAHHLKRVLRVKTGEAVIVFDECGNEYACSVERLSEEIILSIKEKELHSQKKGVVKISVACAIPKKTNMDDIVDKLTQLGVERIIPLLTERVIVKLDKHKKSLRLERWKKIAVQAAKQSHRKALPVVEPVTGIKELFSQCASHDLKLIPTLSGERRTLKDIFSENKAINILVLIGPEGDFTPEEVDLARKAGCIPVSLGDLVLRVDTAAISVASFIRLFNEENR